MNDYELLYYIYQKDEEALDMLMNQYEKLIYFTVKNTMESVNYFPETNDEMNEMIHLARFEFYQSIFKYCDDGRCSFKVFAQKCVEMGIRKYIRSRRSMANYQMSKALRLDEKVCEESGTYFIDTIPNRHKEFEGNQILEWYHEKNVLAFLEDELKENEFLIAKMKIEGYSQVEIGRILLISNKRVNYVCKKIRKLLLSYID